MHAQVRMYTRTLGAIAVATLVAAGAYADNFETDPSAPFATYKTYAWTSGTPSPDPITERRIHAAVEAQMSGKVIRLAAPDETPDIYVATHVVTHQDGAKTSTLSAASGAGTIEPARYSQGALVIDVFDAHTQKMAWRGIASGADSDKPSKNADKIEKALTKLFQRYPSSVN